MNRQMERKTDGLKDRWTERQMDRQKDRITDKETDEMDRKTHGQKYR
jgi:hypothetical protein